MLFLEFPRFQFAFRKGLGYTQIRGLFPAKKREISFHRGARQILNPHLSGAKVPVQNSPRNRAGSRFGTFSLGTNPRIWVQKNMQCIILAGGLATRLRPLTENIPKALIPIANRPFIDYQLEWLKQKGVTSVILSIGYKGDNIRGFVGDGKKWGLKVQYVDEGLDLKGTAGALRLAYEQGVLEESFFVTYGDSYLPIDFQAVWGAFLAQEKPALMTVYRNEGRWDTSNVWYEKGQVCLYDKAKRHPESAEKLSFIDYGLSAFKKEIVPKRIPAGTRTDLAEILYRLSREGLLAGYETSTRFYEIGSPQGLKDFSNCILSQSDNP